MCLIMCYIPFMILSFRRCRVSPFISYLLMMKLVFNQHKENSVGLKEKLGIIVVIIEEKRHRFRVLIELSHSQENVKVQNIR